MNAVPFCEQLRLGTMISQTPHCFQAQPHWRDGTQHPPGKGPSQLFCPRLPALAQFHPSCLQIQLLDHGVWAICFPVRSGSCVFVTFNSSGVRVGGGDRKEESEAKDRQKGKVRVRDRVPTSETPPSQRQPVHSVHVFPENTSSCFLSAFLNHCTREPD